MSNINHNYPEKKNSVRHNYWEKYNICGHIMYCFNKLNISQKHKILEDLSDRYNLEIDYSNSVSFDRIHKEKLEKTKMRLAKQHNKHA